MIRQLSRFKNIFLLGALVSCKPNYDKIFKENNLSFEKNRQTLNLIVSDVEKNYLAKWDKENDLIIPIHSLSDDLKIKLNDIGIGSIEITHNQYENCRKNYWITLNVAEDWNIRTLRIVQLVYAPCGKNTAKNYHYYDGHFRDFWGQGGDWLIYSANDFI